MGRALPCIFAIAQSNSLTEPLLSSLRQHSRQSRLVAVPSKQTLRTCLILSQPSRLQYMHWQHEGTHMLYKKSLLIIMQ